MNSIESLRAILAKFPPPKSSTVKSPQQQVQAPALSPARGPPTQAIDIPASRPRPELVYPSVDVSSYSPKPVTSTSSSSGSFFKLFQRQNESDTHGRGQRSRSRTDELHDTPPIVASYTHPSSPYLFASSFSAPKPHEASFPSPRGLNPVAKEKQDSNHARRHTPSAATHAPKAHNRKVSWFDQTTHPTPSDYASKQAALGSKDDDTSSGENTCSTLSLTSTLDPAATALTPTPFDDQTAMSATLAAAREMNQSKGSIWDPENDEWLDAGKVVETFHETYKVPAPPLSSSTSTGALSYYFGTAIQDTVQSVLASSTKRGKEEQELRAAEEEQDKIDELGNTYYCDPEGDLNDEVMKDVFLGPSRFFPGECLDSPRSMHLINLDAYFKPDYVLLGHARPRLCDAVATVLSHTSKECIKAFLDPSIVEFAYRRKVDKNEGGLILIIRRHGNEVICGAYHNLGFKMLWKLYVKSVVSITGQWHEVYATTKPAEMMVNRGMPGWGTIGEQRAVKDEKLETTTTTDGVQRKLELSQTKQMAKPVGDVNETNAKFMLYQSRVLAMHLLWDMWYRFDKKVECRATWTADGNDSIVRLKSSLVRGEDEDEED